MNLEHFLQMVYFGEHSKTILYYISLLLILIGLYLIKNFH